MSLASQGQEINYSLFSDNNKKGRDMADPALVSCLKGMAD
jgi:hypothetical protein